MNIQTVCLYSVDDFEVLYLRSRQKLVIMTEQEEWVFPITITAVYDTDKIWQIGQTLFFFF